MLDVLRNCSNCKHQISYVFHAECSKNYSKCNSDGKYVLFEKYLPVNSVNLFK